MVSGHSTTAPFIRGITAVAIFSLSQAPCPARPSWMCFSAVWSRRWGLLVRLACRLVRMTTRTTFGPGGGLGTFGSVSLDNSIGFLSGCKDAPTDGIPATDMPADRDLSREVSQTLSGSRLILSVVFQKARRSRAFAFGRLSPPLSKLRIRSWKEIEVPTLSHKTRQGLHPWSFIALDCLYSGQVASILTFVW